MTARRPKKVGLLVGRERSFPDALIAEVARRGEEVVASYATLDITRIDAPPDYDVLVDRISHDIPCYQPVLKLAMLAGTRVVNDPFWRIADDKLYNAALAAQLGVAVPKTAVLPSKSYGPDITSGSLSNLTYPLDWEGLARDFGFPMYMKPHWGGGFRDVSRIENMDSLFAAYDKSGDKTMIVQEGIEWSQYVRCIVVGAGPSARELGRPGHVLPALWDPRLGHFERYVRAHETMPPLAPELEARVVDDAQKICGALGYEMNTVEFAIRNGVPYAIDFMNPVPDAKPETVTPLYFTWLVKTVADVAIEYARQGARTPYQFQNGTAAVQPPRFRLPSYLPE